MLANISLIASNFYVIVDGFYILSSHSLFYIVIYAALTHIFSFFLSLFIILSFGREYLQRMHLILSTFGLTPCRVIPRGITHILNLSYPTDGISI